MTTFQKIVKALAIALAVYIIYVIISAIIGIFTGIAGVTRLFNIVNKEVETISTENVFNIEDVKNLKLEIGIENLKILEGDNEFKVVARNVPVPYTCSLNNETLEVNCSSLTKNKINYNFNKDYEITVYIPEGFIFNNADINLGVGETEIKKLRAEKLVIEAGVGKVDMNYVEAIDNAKINCGVGNFNIHDSILNNLDFSSGVGQVNITSALSGRCKINSGVGELNVNLKDFVEETSSLKLEKGLGQVKVNGKSYSDSQEFGFGEDNVIEIEGGIGQISVEY